jgi:hypothetical protein
MKRYVAFCYLHELLCFWLLIVSCLRRHTTQEVQAIKNKIESLQKEMVRINHHLWRLQLIHNCVLVLPGLTHVCIVFVNRALCNKRLMEPTTSRTLMTDAERNFVLNWMNSANSVPKSMKLVERSWTKLSRSRLT